MGRTPPVLARGDPGAQLLWTVTQDWAHLKAKVRVMEVTPAAAHPPLSPAGWRERAKAFVPGSYSLPRPGRTLPTGVPVTPGNAGDQQTTYKRAQEEGPAPVTCPAESQNGHDLLFSFLKTYLFILVRGKQRVSSRLPRERGARLGLSLTT